MIELDPHTTIGQALERAAERYGDRPLLAVPAHPQRDYDGEGREISFTQAAETVRALARRYAAAGYGLGHRVGLLLENRPEHLLHKLALNSLGACCVPINPDYRPPETAYLVDHARPDLLLVLHSRRADVDAALQLSAHRPAVAGLQALDTTPLPRCATPAQAGAVQADTPASILYTSGTTGRPKGCVLSHRYELASGLAYATRGGLATLQEGQERIYNPLPLFHVNASILSFFCVLLTGGCQVQSDRFHPLRFWQEVRQTRATVVHYLGVIVQMLMAQPPSAQDRAHAVRFGFGAGVEPQLHAAFEARFGFPLLELWGMTEMVRALVDCHAPRQVGTRAFGRPLPEAGVQAMVVDEAGEEVPRGTVGELVIRHSAETPRQDFFSGYLDDPEATEDAWRGGWFHTGDLVTQDGGGMLHFVDRRKNIIRRSGENIAAAEVEATLLTHPWVQQAAVMAVPDDIREEEVLACVVLQPGLDPGLHADAARALFAHCDSQLAYYKPPGWICFVERIPTTGTQKIQKHAIFPGGTDPRQAPGAVDLRDLKKKRR
ncbi:Short-chain-fatty-acid--CoA ligase [Delftia tsuruhatensis]|uniref:AMP-binding protein n=1 Tax=Delftia tsuruhatensis TaxID=180282 RepID=UPI001E704D3E|nr:AMP-binding protein [Delftia tsuruhatensis]CAB5684113.1 Short-chain-fatty-acid--CoA ligase [Delftia tsuruhatensis]CAC9675996.1 Short-chain-fatty-acid--CoA ligase [Delftia tsuruhatensis]